MPGVAFNSIDAALEEAGYMATRCGSPYVLWHDGKYYRVSASDKISNRACILEIVHP